MLKARKNDITVSGLGASYKSGDGAMEVIANISFAAERGSLIAIIGPSGCGKTTLLRILSQPVNPLPERLQLTGDVRIDEERALKCATIEQRPALFPWRTAFQNVCIGAELRGELIKEKCGRIRDSFKEYRLNGFEDHFPAELSGGMQQRVAILRALNSEPDLLFCDEPFSAIDFVTRLTLNTLFKAMCRDLKCTTLFVTHNIEEAIFLADRIIVLSQRPCKVLDDFAPKLSRYPMDAVRCRESPEFGEYFNRIWQCLEPSSQ